VRGFERDEKKNRAKQKMHGISVEAAQTVFYDEQLRMHLSPTASEMANCPLTDAPKCATSATKRDT